MFKDLQEQLQKTMEENVYHDDIQKYKETRKRLTAEAKEKIAKEPAALRSQLRKQLDEILKEQDRKAFNKQWTTNNPARWVEIETHGGERMFALQLSEGCLIQWGSAAPIFVETAEVFEAEDKWHLKGPKQMIVDMVNFLRD